MKKYLTVMMTVAMSASLVVGCRRGGGGTAASTSSGGGGGSATTEVTSVTALVQSIGMYALVRSAGVIQPSAITNYTVPCTSGGPISVNGSGANAVLVSNTLSVSGNVAATFNGCVEQGITFGGSWAESFSMNDTFVPNISSPSSFTMTGNLTVGPSTITLTPGGSCAVNFTETFSGMSVNFTTYAITGTLNYSGTICGVSMSGSCNMATGACT